MDGRNELLFDERGNTPEAMVLVEARMMKRLRMIFFSSLFFCTNRINWAKY